MAAVSSSAPSRPRRASHSFAPSPPVPSAPRAPASRVSHRPTPSQAAAARRASVVAPPADSKDALAASLKQETEHKEQLLVQVQNKDNTISDLTKENASLISTLNAAETTLSDLYAEQLRMEDEMAARIDVSDKLRAQLRELEKEKRDLQRRYNEQTSTFEAERQAFYDNEQHLKSRIQSLSQARKQAERSRTPEPSEPDTENEQVDQDFSIEEPDPVGQDMNDPENEPAEMTSLKLELSTLSTSYASLQNTLVLLQTQLVDLKRVNNELQEDNESYMILLREKTLSGQFDVLKQVGGATSTTDGDYDDEFGEAGPDDREEVGSTGSSGTGRSRTLDRVDEEVGEDASGNEHDPDAEPLSPRSGSRRSAGRHPRQGGSASPDSAPRGESLAGLPITGPGLDLAAELGRAESNNPMSSDIEESERPLGRKNKRGKKGSTESRKVSNPDGVDFHDVETLRSEVKSLKDANKALSLYASKIIDRIIAQEGFEHVLSVDYEPGAPTPLTPSPKESPVKKPRPQTTIFSLGSKPIPKIITSEVPGSPQPAASATNSPEPSRASRAQRRSLSIDWKSFSLFGGSDKKESANLRPLTLKPGAVPVTGARKLDTEEDEEDRRERERLNATMKLMGIEKPPASPALSNSTSGSHHVAPPLEKSYSSPSPQSPPPTAIPSRFSLFRSRSTTTSDSSAANSGRSFGLGIGGSTPQNELTQEALEQAEAESSLATLDAHERTLSEEISKGGSGGFTEITRKSLSDERRSRRSRRSAGGSGSTVWSAGMSRHEEDDS